MSSSRPLAHSPATWDPRGLFSVSPWTAKHLQNLFVLSGRVAMLGRWRYGLFSMIPVGATNAIGSIKIKFDTVRTLPYFFLSILFTYITLTWPLFRNSTNGMEWSRPSASPGNLRRSHLFRRIAPAQQSASHRCTGNGGFCLGCSCLRRQRRSSLWCGPDRKCM